MGMVIFPAKIFMHYTREARKGDHYPRENGYSDIPHSTYIGIIREMLNKGDLKLKRKNDHGDTPRQHMYYTREAK